VLSTIAAVKYKIKALPDNRTMIARVIARLFLRVEPAPGFL